MEVLEIKVEILKGNGYLAELNAPLRGRPLLAYVITGIVYR
jgi:hypothetical protein